MQLKVDTDTLFTINFLLEMLEGGFVIIDRINKAVLLFRPWKCRYSLMLCT